MKYYLAYGSNLNVRQMMHRCPGAKPVGKMVLEGYELLFKGSKTGSYGYERIPGADFKGWFRVYFLLCGHILMTKMLEVPKGS